MPTGLLKAMYTRLDFIYDKFSVYFYFLSRKNTHSYLGAFAIDSHTAFFDEAVGFAPGAESGVADIFI